MPENVMTIDWDVPIEMDDGTVLRADVFRPAAPGRYPVILTHGVYGKGLAIERFRHRLFALSAALPDNVRSADLADTIDPDATDDVAPGDYRVWEVVDPSVWVPAGYVCVRVDSRGSGASPGYLDPMAPREIDDYVACIEWAGTQDWSAGRVGLCGKSYYAMTQWLVAARQPRHLAAICVWHGLSDWYRDATRHGGILYQFWEKFWYPQLALPVQYGADAGTNPHSGRPVTGEESFDTAALAAHRADLPQNLRDHPVDDDYYHQRTPQLDRVTVPVLAAADWSDHDLHLRGTIRGFRQVSSDSTWLEIHSGGQFDDPDAAQLQRRFFDHHLKDGAGDWHTQPRVQLAVREVTGSTTRYDADEWPPPGTSHTAHYLDLTTGTLTPQPPTEAASTAYDATGEGIELPGTPATRDTTLLGPVSARLFISSSTTDADLFLTLNATGPHGDRIELRDHRGGLTPVSIGWQRASLRAVDSARSTTGQPFHPFDQPRPLIPGEVAEVEIELCPTSLYLPAGYRLQLTVCGHGAAHEDPADRPPAIYANTVTLHTGPATPSQLLVTTIDLPATPAQHDQPEHVTIRTPTAANTGDCKNNGLTPVTGRTDVPPERETP